MTSTPEAAAPLPLEGGEARGPKPTRVGVDGPRNSHLSRQCGLPGTQAAGQSPNRGVRLEVASAAP